MSELNDPRVLFAAERTLLAWVRTSVTLIAFGFIVERSALFAETVIGAPKRFDVGIAAWIGLAFVLLGAALSALAVVQYRRTLKTLKPSEIPHGYLVNLAVLASLCVALLGVALVVYLLLGLPPPT